MAVASGLPRFLQARPNMPFRMNCSCCRPSSEARLLQGQGKGKVMEGHWCGAGRVVVHREGAYGSTLYTNV